MSTGEEISGRRQLVEHERHWVRTKIAKEQHWGFLWHRLKIWGGTATAIAVSVAAFQKLDVLMIYRFLSGLFALLM